MLGCTESIGRLWTAPNSGALRAGLRQCSRQSTAQYGPEFNIERTKMYSSCKRRWKGCPFAWGRCLCCATPPTSGRGCQPSPVCLSQLPLHGKAHICRESKLGKLQLLEQVSLGREHRGKKNTTLLPVTKRDAVYFGFQQHGAQPHKLFPAPVSSIPLEPAALKRHVRLHSCHCNAAMSMLVDGGRLALPAQTCAVCGRATRGLDVSVVRTLIPFQHRAMYRLLALL